MRIRSVAIAIVAFVITACGDRATPTAPTVALAPVTMERDMVALDAQIDGLIDQIFTSPIVRMYVHASWNWLSAQVATCPPSQGTLKLQAYLDRLVTYMQASAPRTGTKRLLLQQLVTAMSSYVNEAVAACPTT